MTRRLLMLAMLAVCGMRSAEGAADDFWVTIVENNITTPLKNESASSDSWRFDYVSDGKSTLTVTGGATEADRRELIVWRMPVSPSSGVLARLVVTGKADVFLRNVNITTPSGWTDKSAVEIAPGADVRLKFLGQDNAIGHLSNTDRSAVTCPEGSRLVLCGDTGIGSGYQLREGDAPGRLALTVSPLLTDGRLPQCVLISGSRGVVAIGNAQGLCGDIRLEDINLAIENNDGSFSQNVYCFGNGSGYEDRPAAVTFGKNVAFCTTANTASKKMLMRAMCASRVHDECGRPLVPFSEDPDSTVGFVLYLPVCHLSVQSGPLQTKSSYIVWRHQCEKVEEN